MNKTVKTIIILVLLAIAIYLSYLIYDGIMEPIRFQKAYKYRREVVKKKLIKIRDAEVAFRSKYGRYTGSFDTLIDFIKHDSILIVKQKGTLPDSLFVKYGKKEGEKKAIELGIIKRDTIKIAVKDTLFKNYDPDTLKYVPFSNPREEFQIRAGKIKTLSNAVMPVFEVRVHNNTYLKGLNRQMVINLNDAARDNDEYPGLIIGSMTEVTTAGNWDD